MTSLHNDLISYIRLDYDNCDIVNIFIYTQRKKNNRTNLSNLDIKKYQMCKNKHIECCICCENVKEREYIRELNCGHCFHKKCIDKWLLNSMREKETVTCPVCRTIINLI
jgi:hypothetical protein